MPRLLYGNFDFEETLAAPHQQRSQVVARILAELAPTWIAVAQAGDLLWCPQPIETSFFDQLVDEGFPRVNPVSDFDDIPAECDFVPWGWTLQANDWGTSVNATIDAPPLKAVQTVNSRRFAWEQEGARGLQLPGSRMVTAWPEIVDFVETEKSLSDHWVIKCEFSQSGRDRYRFDASTSTSRDGLFAWARPRLEAGQSLFVEPYLDARAEVGIQLTVRHDGQVICDGVTRTSYRNGAFAIGNFSLTSDEDAEWGDTVAIAIDVGRAAAKLGYFGPLGIDAMRYCDVDGVHRVRAIQDVNARWTMGRLSLGHRRLLNPGEQGCWLMGQAARDLEAAESVSLPRRRIIATSPARIADKPVRLKSCVVIETAE